MKTLFSLLFAFIILGVNGQEQVERCMSHKYIDYVEAQQPGYQQLVEQSFNYAKNNPSPYRTNHTYTIPVVVHIVHNTAQQNLADSVVLEQIESLNEDYQRLNEDTVFMRSQFDPVKGNPNIKFQLASIDPDGNPTTGITRTNTSIQTFGSFSVALGDFDDLERVKSTVDGGHDPWDTEKYLNIWVCNMEILGSPALLGYASPPAGLPNWPASQLPPIDDGVVIQYQAFGRNNPNDLDMGNGPITVRGRTVTHEVGHYLGLRHIWADGDCNEEDGIDDTPNADDQSDFDCVDTKNTCTDNIPNVGDLDDMIENYMDYSAETCQNSFTQGQVDLMRGVLENQRYDLVHGNPASVERELNTTSVSVYPNPAEDHLNVSFGDAFEGDVQLIDLNGKKLKHYKVPSKSLIELNVNDLESGFYLLHITNIDGANTVIKWNKF